MHFISSCLLLCAFHTLGSDCENILKVIGQNVSLNCSVNIDVGADIKFAWKVPDELQQLQNAVQGRLVDDPENRTATVLLNIQNVTAIDAGEYNISCEATRSPAFTADGKNYTLTIFFIGQNVSLNCTVNVDVGAYIKFAWKVSDEQQLQNAVQDCLFDNRENRTAILSLNIQNVTAADAGQYMCEVTRNSVHTEGNNNTLTMFYEPESNGYNENLTLIIGCAMLTTAILAATCFNVKRIMFRNCSNSNSRIEGQLDLLPIVKIFDFPKLQLKLGKELGLGKFGVVCKAEAIGMITDVTITTVCVKMAKSNTDQTHINALRSELDIMIHIGMHLNIVNLLGAYTGSINKKLMVITEYCRFGNIHYYLSSQRDSFINQIKPDGKLDFNIFTTSRNPYSVNKTKNKNVPGKHDESSTQIIDVDEYLIPGETKWYINYRGDYYNNIKPSCTYDLVCWSLQIARGMEYVASKKIFQFNLTTRNILLAEGNIVKICDFESSKIISDDENYKMISSRYLPIKWLAIESLRDKVYLTQSSIWTYGIVLWEIFSLCATPYANMAVKDLLNELVKGYRLEQPPFANKRIFKIMLNCWKTDPLERPSYKNVAYNLGCLLKRGTISYLADLNDNYVKLNDEKLPTKDYSILIPVTSKY